MTITDIAMHLDRTSLNEQMARDVRAGLARRTEGVASEVLLRCPWQRTLR